MRDASGSFRKEANEERLMKNTRDDVQDESHVEEEGWTLLYGCWFFIEIAFWILASLCC